ncbi:MAG: tetratricopeptide repeat protein [Anaerolineales bacterium]|nr:tetratricopeptide repeat protein [Anaerolineales bacterium]MCB8951272.1 tetratricopeptide repeat protein [Ardenticatenales bacterium]
MTDDIQHSQALALFEHAHRHQMRREYADAIILYKRSIALFPTAKAYTFLGWTYSLLHRYEEAIAACKEAITVDPTYGNPYNDIGAYLIELGQPEEAIPWLQNAITAPRYDSPQYAHFNLGRVHEALGKYEAALTCYNQALQIDPMYLSAAAIKYRLLGKMN